jgi:hypothetical protein
MSVSPGSLGVVHADAAFDAHRHLTPHRLRRGIGKRGDTDATVAHQAATVVRVRVRRRAAGVDVDLPSRYRINQATF